MKDNRMRLFMLASLALGYFLGRKVLASSVSREREESSPPPARKRSAGGARRAGAQRPARRPAPSTSGEREKSTG